ncbi:MAG: energy-coupling factor ABC transporter ATP-binding protein, partial [Nitrospinota bacterium]
KTSHHLSFGEKKRVSVATVLSMSPKVIALDEPSSNLDPKHRRGLIDLLNSFDLTKVVVTHDLDLVSKICSRVIIIDRGEITADGLAADILNDRELLAKHDLAAD